MLEFIKKSMFVGLGLMSLTRERMEEISNKLVEKGELTEKEGQDFVEELSEKSEEAKEEMQKKVQTMVQKALSRMDLATKEDLERLDRKVEALEKALRDKEVEAGGPDRRS